MKPEEIEEFIALINPHLENLEHGKVSASYVESKIRTALADLEGEEKPKRIDQFLIPNSPFYTENFRAINKLNSTQAKVLLERMVIRGKLDAKHGIKCRSCRRIIIYIPFGDALPKNINCINCELMEKDEFEFAPTKNDLISVYELPIVLKNLKNPE